MPARLTPTVLQFGAGRFLRGFIDRFIHEANESGQAFGRVVVVQSTPGERAARINAQPGGFPVVVRGYERGNLVDRVDPVANIERALVASNQWEEVLTLARSPQLRLLVTNATEAGYVLDAERKLPTAAPCTMPGKLTAVLWERYRANAAPLMILPCELIQQNADRLCELVLEQAKQWNLDEGFQSWLAGECRWLNNLVDCMITDLPADDPRLLENPLAVQAEPYALLAIQTGGGSPESKLSMFEHPAIELVEDLEPYYLRKVRILNGLHTAMVGKFLGRGFETVQQIMNDPAAERWVRDLLFEEIVPTIAYRVEGVAQFAETTLDRFRNPFLAHRLADISLNHAQKVEVRLRPTSDEYQKLFGRPPRRIAEAIERDLSQP